MAGLINIIDYGTSAYRLGYGGDIAYDKTQEPEKRSVNEFIRFLVKETENTQDVIYIEKNEKNRKTRESVVEGLFEELNIERLLIVKSATMSLYSIGKSSGFVQESSETTNELLCVEDGYLDTNHSKKSTFPICEVFKQYKHINTKTLRSIFNENNTEFKLPDGSMINTSHYFMNEKLMYDNFTKQKIQANPMILLTGNVMSIPTFYQSAKELMTRWMTSSTRASSPRLV